jgi:hypothetical protein
MAKITNSQVKLYLDKVERHLLAKLKAERPEYSDLDIGSFCHMFIKEQETVRT